MIDPLQLGLSDQDLQIILQILAAQLPDRPIYAFGSRALGLARRRSDLDMAVGGTTPLSLRQRALLNLDFEESDLPIKVDIVDLNSITPEFRRRIERDFVMVQRGAVLSEAVTP